MNLAAVIEKYPSKQTRMVLVGLVIPVLPWQDIQVFKARNESNLHEGKIGEGKKIKIFNIASLLNEMTNKFKNPAFHQISL
jgi:hypothetical protein